MPLLFVYGVGIGPLAEYFGIVGRACTHAVNRLEPMSVRVGCIVLFDLLFLLK